MNALSYTANPAVAQAGPEQVTQVPPRPRLPDARDYYSERRRYLARARRNPGLRQQFLTDLAYYLVRRALWSFGFFPVVIAVWLPLVLAGFNPVVFAQSLIPHLEAFVSSNPEVQAYMLSNLIAGWVSVGLFFMLFDIILKPFQSPFQAEADRYMRAWSQSQGIVPPDEV